MQKGKHFSNEGLAKAITQIKQRHKHGYDALIKTIITQIRQFRKKTNLSARLLVGISGGIDSTVVAYLAKKAIGPEKLILVYLPATKNDEGMKFYPTVKSYLKVKDTHLISIEDTTKSITKIIANLTKNKLNPITIGNIASRVRINIFYALAKEKKALVLGTSNRTEFVQGYATKYGTPISCDFGVLDDLYKTDILEIALRIGIPAEILQRAPTTGFYIGQTHEEELGATMREQDAAAYLLFEKKMTIGEIVHKYDASKKYLLQFIKRYQANLHKRKLQPDHVSLRYIQHELL